MLNQALRKTVIGQQYFEICALIGAWEFDQQYEWSGHEPGALRAGVSQNVIDAIKYNRGVEELGDKEATLILMGRQLFRGNHQLSSPVWAKIGSAVRRRRHTRSHDDHGRLHNGCYLIECRQPAIAAGS
jgi:hypothetical protein